MAALHLGHFLSAGSDVESAQYRILGGLKQARKDFSNSVIYPALRELIQLRNALKEILEKLDELRDAATPGELKEVDLASQKLIYEKSQSAPDQFGVVEDLIRWALPRIEEAIEEGRTIYEFVEEHVHIEEVGIVPSYTAEGYLLVPDRRMYQVHVLQYSLSVFRSAGEQYRGLKTTPVKSVPQRAVHVPPQSIKLNLLSERRELPNPATYSCSTDLDFSFEQTMLPVAKRKLMRHLHVRRGAA